MVTSAETDFTLEIEHQSAFGERESCTDQRAVHYRDVS
jgi:hypothetical protein